MVDRIVRGCERGSTAMTFSARLSMAVWWALVSVFASISPSSAQPRPSQTLAEMQALLGNPDSMASFERRLAQCERLPESRNRNGCVTYCGRFLSDARGVSPDTLISSSARRLHPYAMSCESKYLAAIKVVATECDRLTADHWDVERAARGVALDDIDTSVALPACEQALQESSGSLRLTYQLGRALQRARRYDDAYERLSAAAEQGYAPAQAAVGVMYWQGSGVAEDPEQGFHWIRKAAMQGYAKAQANMGYAYYAGRGVTQDYTSAALWYERGARQDEPASEYGLGYLYENGMGVERDYAEARAWYSKAVHSDSVQAMRGLAMLYLRGDGGEQSYGRAAGYFRDAAELGDATSQLMLGMLIEEQPQLVRGSDDEALKWYRLAAEQGNEEAKDRYERLTARIAEERAAADAASWWIVDRYALSRMEFTRESNGVRAYREIVEEMSPFLVSRGWEQGRLRGTGHWNVAAGSIEHEFVVWSAPLAEHCHNAITFTGTSRVDPAVSSATAERIADMWVATRPGQCRGVRVELGVCTIHDCGESWSPEDRKIVVKGRDRAIRLWTSMEKREAAPAKVELDWVPF